jgi:hypothetical protein
MAIGKINGVTIAGGGGGGGVNNDTLNWSFFDSSVRNVYIPWKGETENTSLQRYGRWVAPYDGTVTELTFMLMAVNITTGPLDWEFRVYNGVSLAGSQSQSQPATMASWNPYTLSYNLSFTKGQVLALFMTNGSTQSVSNIGGTVLLTIS